MFFSFYLLLCLPTMAQDSLKTFKSEFGFRTDNDAYLGYGQDQYYTNGLFFTYRHANKISDSRKKLSKLIWEIELGQKMYNPSTGEIERIEEVDRPFAAYSYLGAALNQLYKTESNLKLSLQVGILGPSAKGKEVQEFLHNTVGFYEINGWEYQVKDEMAFNTVFEYNTLLGRDKLEKTDLTLNSTARLGNTFSGISAGFTFRAGRIMKLFQSHSTQSNIWGHNQASSPIDESFFYARPLLSFIAYDASIQGPMFRDDKGPVTYDPKSFVFSQELGYAYARSRWTIDLSVTFKSREVKSMAGAHQFGSISLYRRFN